MKDLGKQHNINLDANQDIKQKAKQNDKAVSPGTKRKPGSKFKKTLKKLNVEKIPGSN
jgi:hypothetical protein